MGECGCFGGAGQFRIPAPSGWYRIMLSPRCSYCGVGPSVAIDYEPNDDLYNPEWDEPLTVPPRGPVALFGMDTSDDDMQRAMRAVAIGYEPEGAQLDQLDTEALAEALVAHLPNSPRYIAQEMIQP